LKRRTIFALIVLTFLVSTAVGYIRWQLPKMETLAKLYITKISNDDRVPVSLKTGRIGVRLFPPRVILDDLGISPKESLKEQIDPLVISKVVVEPSIIDLVLGKFWIHRIHIEGTKVKGQVRTKSSDPNKPNFEISKILAKVPVSEILLKSVAVDLTIDRQWKVTAQHLFLKAYNQKNSLLAKIKEPDLSIAKLGTAGKADLLLDTQFMITDNTLSVSKLKLIKEKAFIIGSGNIRFDPKTYNLLEGRGSTRVNGNIKTISEWAKPFIPKSKKLKVNGDFKFDLTFEKSASSMNAAVDGQLNGLKIGKIYLGDIKLEGTSADLKRFSMSSVELGLPGRNNLVNLSKIHFDISDPKNIFFQSDLNIKKMQLHSFLRDSKIAEIPVWLKVNGRLKCQGYVSETTKIQCPGSLELQNFKVDSKKKNIAHFKKLFAEGQATITEKNISYTVDLKMKNSKGKSNGTIDYAKGFDIKYEAEKLDLSELETISEIPFSGITALKGSTQGGTKSAVFDINIQAKNFEFAQYYFGNLNTKLTYLKGTLFFKETLGNLDSTRYKGAFEIDLLAEQISGSFALPFFKMKDVQQAILKKVDLEDRFLGSGSGQLEINSSLDTDRLSFLLSTQLFKGSAFGEEFDKATLNLNSKEGVIVVQKGILQREKTVLNMFGTVKINLESSLNFQIGQGDLKNSTLLKENNLPISGQFSAKGSISGNLGKPKLDIRTRLQDFVFHKKRYGEGLLIYNNTTTAHEIQFDLVDQMKSKIRIPTDGSPKYYFEADAENFDIAPMIGYAVSEVSTKDYILAYSGSASGHYNIKNFWDSEFSALAKKIAILYKGNRLESTLPTNLELKNKRIFLNDFKMLGNDQNLAIENSFSTENHSKFLVNGRINISFFKLFAPFIKRIDGTSTVHLEIHLKKDDFQLLGSSYTKNAYVEFPGFPHPFENLNADIIYNQNKILLNSITGRIAGGDVLGNGEFLLYGPKKFKMNLNLNLEKVNLNFPEGYKSSGDAQIRLSGTEAPFLLSGNYKVASGLIESEFGGTDSGSADGGLLAELLSKNEQSPLVLDIDIDAKQGIAIKNSMIEGDIYGALKVFDKIDVPKVSGGLKLGRTSRLKFQDTEFEITDSQFTFRGETPINPTLFLNAKTRVQDYDISMFIQGDSAQPKLRMTSSPSLSDRQIISLLAFGSLTDDLQTQIQNSGQSQEQQQLQNQSSIQIGTSLLKKNPLGRELERISSGWDVQFSSVIDEGTNLAVPKFTVSKKFNKKVEASMSRREGQRSATEVRVRYDLGDNLSTVLRLRQQEALNSDSFNLPQTDNQVGVDLEYKKEFK